MFVTDYNGQVKEEQSLKALEQLLVPDEVSPGFLQNEEYVGIEASSEVSGLSYYLFVQQDIFWKEARRVRNIHLLSLLLTLLAGAGAVWFLLRRNFKTLSVLLHKIGNESGQKEEKRNEYDRIEKAYSRIHNETIIDSVKRMQLMHYLELLLNAQDLQGLKEEYHKLISFACSKISGQWEAENKKLVQDITEYVEKNYTDSNLNINYIAQVLQRNGFYDYFYHVFFRRNDTGLSECEEFGTSGQSVGADSSGSN